MSLVDEMSQQLRQRYWSASFLAIVVVLGARRAWAGRFAMNPDGISYLDIADSFLHHDWSHVVNGYWSPLYPGILAVGMSVAKPGPRWEFPAVHALNFVIFLFTALAFAAFVRNFQHSAGNEHVRSAEFSALCYASFFFAVVYLIGLAYVTPDLLVAGVVFEAAALITRATVQPTSKTYIALGVCLGMGYLAKAVMLPIGVLCLGAVAFNAGRRGLRLWLAAVLAFCITVLPWVYLLSRARGTVTTGDAGRLAYAYVVYPRIDIMHWDGAPPGSGTPIHPVAKILAHPTIYEFDGPIGGTYPPWYDPVYWHDGARVSFSLKRQLAVLQESLLVYEALFREAAGIIAAFIVVLAFCRGSLRDLRRYWILLAVAVGAFFLYALVLVQPRYIGSFVAVSVVVLFGSLEIPVYHRDTLRALLITAALATVVTTRSTFMPVVANGDEDLVVATAVHRLGMEAHTKVAVAGDGARAYWARLGRFRIVAEIGESTLTSEEQRRAWPVLCRVGVGAVVADFPPADGAGWQRAGSSHYVYPLFDVCRDQAPHARDARSAPQLNFAVRHK
jgi:hypothetical protein